MLVPVVLVSACVMCWLPDIWSAPGPMATQPGAVSALSSMAMWDHIRVRNSCITSIFCITIVAQNRKARQKIPLVIFTSLLIESPLIWKLHLEIFYVTFIFDGKAAVHEYNVEIYEFRLGMYLEVWWSEPLVTSFSFQPLTVPHTVSSFCWKTGEWTKWLCNVVWRATI